MAELPPVDPEKAIAAIRDARPPATDRFTYLTIVEANLIPQALPALEEILQDAELTQDIGWDLVFNLATLPGSDTCLETIARLGNPREVILKVLEALELLEVPRNPDSSGDNDYSSDWSDNISAGDEYSEDDQAEQGKQDHKDETETPVPAEKKFVTFLGMLAILHQRIKTKRPSRFLAQTLQTVHSAYLYRPTPEITAAVINLVHSLSGRRRPALPSRKSSVNVANMDTPEQRGGGAPRNAPDPEAEEDTDQAAIDDSEADEALQQRMLLSFVTCVLERYAEEHDMDWAARLLEFYEPEKLVPGRKTLMGAFREEQKLLERDAVVGQLVVCLFSFPLLLSLSSFHPVTGADWCDAGLDSRLGTEFVLQDIPRPAAEGTLYEQPAVDGGQCSSPRGHRAFHRRLRLADRVLGVLSDRFRCRPTCARDAHLPRPLRLLEQAPRRRPGGPDSELTGLG